MKVEVIDGIEYRLDEDTLTAEAFKRKEGYEGDIIISEIVEFNGVSYRVTSIGDEAFDGCEKLVSITIPEGVITIGEFAFSDCKALTSVTIPSSVMSIGKGGTFQGCTSLKTVQWNAINCTIEAESENSYYPPFFNLRNIKKITFGNDVKSIPTCLCVGLSGLTSIIIPDGVTSIGERVFLGCNSLKVIDILDGVMIVENGAFYGCEMRNL
jgi:hypothetical protein